MLLKTLCLLASVFNDHEVEEREPPGNKYQSQGQNFDDILGLCHQFFLFIYFLQIMVMLSYMRSKTTDKLMEFKVLIFDCLYPYIH